MLNNIIFCYRCIYLQKKYYFLNRKDKYLVYKDIRFRDGEEEGWGRDCARRVFICFCYVLYLKLGGGYVNVCYLFFIIFVCLKYFRIIRANVIISFYIRVVRDC